MATNSHGSEYFPREAGPPKVNFSEPLKQKIRKRANRDGVKPRLYAPDESPRTAGRKKKGK